MRSGVLRLAPGPFLTAPPKRPLKGETSLRYLPCSLFLGVRMGLGPDGTSCLAGVRLPLECYIWFRWLLADCSMLSAGSLGLL